MLDQARSSVYRLPRRCFTRWNHDDLQILLQELLLDKMLITLDLYFQKPPFPFVQPSPIDSRSHFAKDIFKFEDSTGILFLGYVHLHSVLLT